MEMTETKTPEATIEKGAVEPVTCEAEPETDATEDTAAYAPEATDTQTTEEESSEVPTLEDILESDYGELTAEFPEISSLDDISKMEGAIRYGELRELGLSPREAYLATRKKTVREVSARAHLTPATPSAARTAGIAMPRAELKIARELFGELSDSEIESLYKKVTRT